MRLGVVAALAALWLVLEATWLAPDPVVVSVVPLARGRVEATVTNSRAGTLRVRRRAQLSPETSGRVVALASREGDRVAAGDVIVRLDDEVQRAQRALAARSLATAEARHQETCVRARRARRELERNRELAADAIVSVDQLEALESALEVAEAACASSEAQVEEARSSVGVIDAELERTLLRAPFDGVLAEVSVEVGEWITPSPPGVPIPSVIDLIDPASLYVSAPMDEVDSAVVLAGQAVRVSLDPFPGRTFAGRVARVAPYVLDVEQQNRTVEIEVELEDHAQAERLLPGTSADVEVILEVREDVPRLPAQTLLEGGRVLVLEDGRVAERRIRVGLKNWDWVEVQGGLEPGARVIRSLASAEVTPGARAVEEDAARDGDGSAAAP